MHANVPNTRTHDTIVLDQVVFWVYLRFSVSMNWKSTSTLTVHCILHSYKSLRDSREQMDVTRWVTATELIGTYVARFGSKFQGFGCRPFHRAWCATTVRWQAILQNRCHWHVEKSVTNTEPGNVQYSQPFEGNVKFFYHWNIFKNKSKILSRLDFPKNWNNSTQIRSDKFEIK